MNLKLVTFDPDLSQFLVDAEDDYNAIESAIEANKLDYLGPWAKDEIPEEEMYDHACYSVEQVDMNILGEMMKRDDYCCNHNGTLIFSGN